MLTTSVLTAHFPTVAPEIIRALENEKPLAADTAKGNHEGKPSINLWFTPITPDAHAQLPPLAVKLDGVASHMARLAETVDRTAEERLIILAHNLAAVAEQVAHMENNLEVPA